MSCHNLNPMSKCRNYVFTLNNYTPADVEQLREVECRYICFQGEIGAGGTRHLQGLVIFDNPRALAGVKRVIGDRAHIERMRGTFEQARSYCSKEETADPTLPFIERGTPPQQGARTDLTAVAERIKEGASESQLADEFTEAYLKYHRGIANAVRIRLPVRSFKTEVFWFYGATGTGKSRAAQELCPDAYWKNPAHHWWDGYSGTEDVIVDDYRADFCKFSELLRLFDRYPYQVQVKGGTVNFCSRRIVITTPKHPTDVWYNRTAEDLQQLLRRIDILREFNLTL